MTHESSLPPCDCFTVLEWRESEKASQCDVCDRPRAAHANPGLRISSGGEIEALRRRIIVETYDQLERQRERNDPDGPS
jgi:hypothetical protein